METLIKELRIAIERGDIGITEIANRAGCSRQHVHAILHGKHRLSLELAEKLAIAIGLQLSIKKKSRKLATRA